MRHKKQSRNLPGTLYRQHLWYEPIVLVNTPPLLCPYMKENLRQYLKLNKAETLSNLLNSITCWKKGLDCGDFPHLFTIMLVCCFKFNNHWKSSKAAGVTPNCCFSFHLCCSGLFSIPSGLAGSYFGKQRKWERNYTSPILLSAILIPFRVQDVCIWGFCFYKSVKKI